jgi:arylformamidase
MSVYPGEPEPKFDPIFMLGTDKVNVTKVIVGSHTGTHVDAPKHFIPKGKSIDKVCLDRYIGEAVILDMSKKRWAEVLMILTLINRGG